MTQLLVWIREHKLSTAGLVLVILGCVALVNLSRRVHHLKPRAAAASAPVEANAPAPNPAPVAALTPSDRAGTEQSGRTSRMRSEFEGARSYAEFIQQAMGRPQEGGKFYALLAWKRCSELAGQGVSASAHAGNEAFHDAAVALVEDMEKRCTGVLEAWPDLPSLYKVAMEQHGGRDFLLPPDGRGLVAPATRQTANTDIDAALRSGDRWAASEALQANAEFLDVGNPSGDDGADRQLRERGAEIVGCELVGSCRGGLEAALHCVASGDCAHDDYRDVVLAEVPETHRVILDTVLAGLHERMGLVPGRTDADKP